MTITYSYEQLCDGFTLAGCRGWLIHAAEQGWTVVDVPEDMLTSVQETPQAEFAQSWSPLETYASTGAIAPALTDQFATTNTFPLPLLFFAGVAAVYGALSQIRGRAIKRDWFQQGPPFHGAEYTEPSPWQEPIQLPDQQPVDLGQMQPVYPQSQTPVYPLEPVSNWGYTGSAPILNRAAAPILNQPEPGAEPLGQLPLHPLEVCPMAIATDPGGYEQNAVNYCLYKNMSQNKTIQMVWGTPKGGSDRYKQAKDRFDFYKSQWEESYGVH